MLTPVVDLSGRVYLVVVFRLEASYVEELCLVGLVYVLVALPSVDVLLRVISSLVLVFSVPVVLVVLSGS